jgi:hypothetical protein
MRSVLGMAIGATLVFAICAAMPPALASCGSVGHFIDSGAAKLISNPDWCGGFGCYGTPPVSSNLDGFFWGQSMANGARLAGVDSGRFLVGSWTQKHEPFVGNDGTYYYNVYLSKPTFGGPFSWNEHGTDNCPTDITPTIPNDECTCMVLTDSWNGQGYMAILSAMANRFGDFRFFDNAVNTPVVFGPIPRPAVTNSTRDATTGDVTFTIAVPTPLGGPGDYRSPLCDCRIGFRVYEQVVGAGGTVSDDRSACTQETLFRTTAQSIAPDDPSFIDACKAAGFPWVPALDPSGATQNFTLFGTPGPAASVKVPCGDPQSAYDIYLSVSLGTNEGPGQIQFPNVSQNSFRVSCGNYQLAEPIRPRNPEAPSQSAPRRIPREGAER